MVIPISAANQDGAVNSDYLVPASVTQDDIDDDGESVVLEFGFLPDRISESATTLTTTVTILDDDIRGVTVHDPTDNTDVTAEPASLTFTPANWSARQPVTVSAIQDADGVNDHATVTHTLSGADYASETASDVSVTVDDETPDVTIDPKRITVLPDGSNEYTVVLDTEPTAPVTVTVGGHTGRT